MFSCLTFRTNVPQSFVVSRLIKSYCPLFFRLSRTSITRWNILSRTIFAFLMLQFAIFSSFSASSLAAFWSSFFAALIKDPSILKMISICRRMCITKNNKIHVKKGTSKSGFRLCFFAAWLSLHESGGIHKNKHKK